jgi:preprotein translocase subunit SecD
VTAEGRTITASFSNLDEGVARRLLLESGRLEFQQPKLDERGFVACVDANGEEFFVSPLRVNPDPAVNSPARCFGDGQLGDPLWEPTPGTTVGGEQLTLAEMIEPASWRISAEGALGPRFTDEGSELLEAVTGHLVGYPLGVFVDDALIGAPRIQRPITNGEPVISGFSELEARIRRAQLNAQPLPAAMTLVN